MNQDVFGYKSDTSGALAILTYTNMYAAYKSTSDPITGSSGSHSVNDHYDNILQTIHSLCLTGYELIRLD